MPRWSVLLVVLGLVLLAGGIRAVGITWDRPFLLHPDESTVTQPAHQLLVSGKMRPRIARGKPAYVYPPLLAEILALECAIYYPFSDWKSLKHVPAASVRMAGRGTTLAAALLTVAFLTLLARKLTGSLLVGALAGAVLALSPLHAESSRYATTDVFAGFWVLLAAWAAVRIVEEGRWRHYLWGGLACGVAAATKYPAGLSCVLIAAAHFCRPGIFRSLGEQTKGLAAALAAIGGLVVALPPGLVDWNEVREGASYAAFVYGRGHRGFQSPHPALDGARTLWSVGFGETATIASLLWLRGATSRRRIVPIIVLVAAYLMLLGSQGLFVARNLLHFVPATLLLAASGISIVIERVRRVHVIAVVGVAAAIVAPVAVRAALQVRALAATDNRLLAREWIAANLAPGTKVAQAGGTGFVAVPLSGLKLKIRPSNRPTFHTLAKWGYRWVVYSDGSDVRYLRSPDRFAKEAEAIRKWQRYAQKHGKLVRHFPRRPLPGGDLPGSTAAIYHQPEIRIYRIDPPAKKNAKPRQGAAASPPKSAEPAEGGRPASPDVGSGRGGE